MKRSPDYGDMCVMALARVRTVSLKHAGGVKRPKKLGERPSLLGM